MLAGFSPAITRRAAAFPVAPTAATIGARWAGHHLDGSRRLPLASLDACDPELGRHHRTKR
jgi:hypothetical protein